MDLLGALKDGMLSAGASVRPGYYAQNRFCSIGGLGLGLDNDHLSRNYSVIREPKSGAARRRELRPLLNCFDQDDPDLIEMVGLILLWSK